MKFFYLPLILLTAIQPGLGQNDYRVIGAAHEIEASISSDYYIQAIEDQRAFQANLGIVNRGLWNDLKRQLILETGFWDSLLKQMNAWLLPQENAEPIVVKVQELYLWENRGMKAEQGFIRLKLSFAPAGKEVETVVAVELSGKETTVLDGHAKRLEAAFFRCLQQYDEKRKNDGEGITSVFSAQDGAGRADILAARNFLNLWKGELFPASGSLRNKGVLFRYQLYRRGAPAEQPYYALLRKNKLYLWAGNYTGAGEYYTQVLEQGRYLFLIDELFIKQGSELAAKLGEATSRVGILIDMETGAPQIVDDELMEKLMKPYPALVEKYLFKDILKFPFQLTRVQNVIAEINQMEPKN